MSLAVFAVLLSLASGIGIPVALGALTLSGISAIGGSIRYALPTIVIVTLDLLFVSVLPQAQEPVRALAVYVGLPYIITFALVGIGLYRRNKLKGLE